MPAKDVHDHLEQHHEIDHHEEDHEQRPEKLSEAQDHAHAPLGMVRRRGPVQPVLYHAPRYPWRPVASFERMRLVADTKIVLPDSEIPRSWYNILADAPHPPPPPPPPPPAAAAPGHRAADRARRPGAAVPHGSDPAGGLDRPRDPDPRRG